MREIKFRAWAKYGEMFPNVQNHINGGWAFGNMLMKPDEFTIMQYAGLMDSEGVDIYEGDIVPFNGEHLKCIIDTDGVWFENDNVTMRHDDFKKYGESLIVIGNIHENPELLS